MSGMESLGLLYLVFWAIILIALTVVKALTQSNRVQEETCLICPLGGLRTFVIPNLASGN